MDRKAVNRQLAAPLVVLIGLIVTAVLYASASDLRRVAGQVQTIELEYVSDTPTEDVRNVDVYVSGYIDNPLRTFPAAHPAHDFIAKVRPDEHGRVSMRVPYYESYRVEAFLPRENWGDPRGIQVHLEYVYGLGGVPDGRVRATLELAAARRLEF